MLHQKKPPRLGSKSHLQCMAVDLGIQEKLRNIRREQCWIRCEVASASDTKVHFFGFFILSRKVLFFPKSVIVLFCLKLWKSASCLMLTWMKGTQAAIQYKMSWITWLSWGRYRNQSLCPKSGRQIKSEIRWVRRKLGAFIHTLHAVVFILWDLLFHCHVHLRKINVKSTQSLSNALMYLEISFVTINNYKEERWTMLRA